MHGGGVTSLCHPASIDNRVLCSIVYAASDSSGEVTSVTDRPLPSSKAIHATSLGMGMPWEQDYGVQSAE